MDNFDLREYLKENRLLKENKQHFVYKTTFPNGDTFYSVSEQNPTPELFKNKTISVALNNTSKGRATTNFQNQVADLQNPKEELEVELVDTFDTKEEANTLKDESIDNDPNSINSGGNYKDKSGAKSNQTINLSKEDSLSSNGEYYVAAAKLNKYPDLKGKVDMNSKLNHPLKGLYYKLTTNRVNRT